jgi:hypothetical protein
MPNHSERELSHMEFEKNLLKHLQDMHKNIFMPLFKLCLVTDPNG